jgi:SAM-dependent methyltransferase
VVDLEFTGERVVPGQMRDLGNVFVEHLARYVFAVGLLRGNEVVVDAACGTGYGSQLLAMASHSVLGLDISDDSVEFAKAHFSWPGLGFAVADVEDLVLPSHLDAVVSFETIEHLDDPSRFLHGVTRAIEPDGMLVVSVPRNLPSQWHKHVYDFRGAKQLVEEHFPFVDWYFQRGSLIAERRVADANFFIAVCRMHAVKSAPKPTTRRRSRLLHRLRALGGRALVSP